MSIPNLPNITPQISLNDNEVFNLLLSSIAMEEIGLSHIINAEGEKLQYVLGTLPDRKPPENVTISDLLDVNRSVRDTLQEIKETEMILSSKLKAALDNRQTVKPGLTSNFTVLQDVKTDFK